MSDSDKTPPQEPLFDFKDTRSVKKDTETATARVSKIDDVEGSNERSSQYRSLNAFMAGAIVVIVAISPIFVGSNRPIFWMFWTMVLGVLGLVYLGRTARFKHQRPYRLRQFKVFFAIYGAFLAFALIQTIPIPGLGRALSDMPDASLMGVLRMIGLVIFFALALEVSGRTSRGHWMSWAIFYAVGAHALWALISLNILNDVTLWGEKEFYVGYATGTFVNRNSFATFLAMGLVVGVSLVLEKTGEAQLRHSRKLNILNAYSLRDCIRWMTFVPIVMALLATQSRAGYFVSLVGVVLCIGLMGHYVAPHKKRVYAILSAACVAAAVIGLIFTGILDRAIVVERSADGRVGLYQHIFSMILERPFLGHGTDTFWSSFERGHSIDLRSDSYWDLAHSSYLMLWFEYGLIFGSLPMIALGAILVRIIHVMRRRPSQQRGPIAALVVLVVVALHATVDFSAEIQANVFLFLAILAIGLGRYKRDNT